jgi:hypothetical protein
MKALKIIDEKGSVDQQAEEDYAKIFSEPLSDSHVEVLAALFGWSLTLSTGIPGNREGDSLIVA